MKKSQIFIILLLIAVSSYGQTLHSSENYIIKPDIQDVLLSTDKLKSSATKGGDNTFVTESDSLALVALYNATNGDNWVNNSNWLTGPVNTWYGIEVSSSRVVEINFNNSGSGNNLTGSLPTELGNLTNLRYLNLYSNHLSGSIPAELGNLTNLVTLYLALNQLTGSIPAELGRLTNLSGLHLYYNQLSGSIPVELGNLTNLFVLELLGNQLSGSIPTELGNLTNLSYLLLNNNQLSGSIPAELGNLTNLSYLLLNNNQLSGSIPAELGNLTSLFYFSLNNNQLSGSIPAELGNLAFLKSLRLYYNQLSGSIPTELGNLSSLNYLELYGNQLSGEIPVSLGNLTNLTTLDIGINPLTGTIPSVLGNLVNLTSLWLNNSNLEGEIPASLGNLTNLQILGLEVCQLEGSIPAELGNLTNLNTLYLEGNQFTDLPDLSALTSLNTLHLFDNEFTFGDLENSGFNFSAITIVNYAPQARLILSQVDNGDNTTTLSLTTDGTGNTYQWYKNETAVSGENSNTLTVDNTEECYYYCMVSNSNYPDLILKTYSAIFNLTLNHGILEKEYDALVALYNSTSGDNWTNNTNWLSDMDVNEWYGVTVEDINVTEIELAANNLSGAIPSSIGNLTNLNYLRFSSNQLTGSIPSSIGNLTSLNYLFLTYNQLSGLIPRELGDLINLTNLALGDNQLTGSIPAELGNLTNLAYLYLWGNQLIGSVPSEIGSLTNLVYLHLEHNQLTDLPDLSALTALSRLYLYDNKLTFGDLENTGLNFSAISNVGYASQAILPEPGQVDNGDNTTTLSVTTGGTGNAYQWYKNGVLMSGETSNTITIDNTEECYYYCMISNSNYPSLILETEHSVFNMTMSHGVLEKEYNELVALYNSTNGASWTNNTNWLSDKDVNEWYGITVDDIRVTKIELGGNNLSGAIPAGLSNLLHLQYLSLDNNQLTGLIPPELGSLTNLIDLQIWENQLSGEIPVSLGNLTNLTLLDIGFNSLTGTIPSELGSLVNLTTLWLNDCNLEGEIPASLGNLTNLQILGLSACQLVGSIPAELGNLTNLQVLYLNNNQLSGSIPPELGSLTNLYTLYLYTNQLTGSVPSDLGNLTNMQYLALHNNQLIGSIPSELGNLTNLRWLYLNDNKFTGLPDLSALTLLNPLYLNGNEFSFGDLENTGLNFPSISIVEYTPQELLPKPTPVDNGDNTTTLSVTTDGTGNTYQWYKNETELSGETSHTINVDNREECYYYCVVSNPNYPELKLATGAVVFNMNTSHGVLEDEYNALVALYNSTNGDNWIDNTNWLSDKDVNEWYGITTDGVHVTKIELNENNLTNSLPEEIYDLTSLTELWLRFNELEGTISSNIQNLSKLEVLQLRSNNLTGTIPTEIGNITSLTGMNLSQTKLTGSVPESFNNLVNLQNLYLYETNLSDLPDLSALTNLQDLYVDQGKFTFEDFDNAGIDFNSLITWNYAPQDTLRLITSDTTVIEGEQFILNCQNFTIENLSSSNNLYAVYKDDVIIRNWSADNEYIISSVSSDDAGKYTMQVSNSSFPALTLLSDTLLIKVVNHPTDIQLSNNAIDEDEAIGTVVGEMSTTDPDAGDTFTYSFATGDGSNDADNASFTIDAANLKTAVTLDYESQSSYHIYVKVEDAEGLSYEDAFVVSVTNVNEAPTALSLSANAIDEDAALGTVVGELSTTDPDAGDTFTYSFAAGDGSNDADNASFTIDAANLKTAVTLDYETQSSYHIYVKVEDAEGLSYDKAFTISVNDVTETKIENLFNQNILVYPNPTADYITLKIEDYSSNELRYHIYDMQGKLLESKIVTDDQTSIAMDKFTPATYLLKVIQNNREINTFRIIKR